MIRSIIKQESFFSSMQEHFSELKLTEDDWTFMKEYETAFLPLHKMTKLLHTQHQVFSEFYMQWILALKNVRELKDNRFSKHLADTLEKRLEMLRGTMLFKAALSLDPRFNYLDSTFFSSDEKIESQNYILNVWRRMQIIGGFAKQNDSLEQANISVEDQDITDYLTELFGGKLDPKTEATIEIDIQIQLKLLEVEPRQRHDFDIWTHWISRKTSHPQLAQVALVILATPSRQVSVERSFSALALVLSDHRTAISDDTLEDILILKLNDDIFETVFPSMYDWKNLNR
ncbi:uncharacterized protein LOC131688448 [Topomyia yanbarensis]|uniref:uncharacterized protein LOC131688448 n=1 Tax=Topomyia yanbarensis TaxID=2498891 RepID=UPI00273BDE70|nr:uncharacterized protein LOC131688448 [Topomyia yanbarensis]